LSATLRISDLPAAANRLRDRLATARTRALPQFEWYPYDSLANVYQLERLLGSRYDFLLQGAQSGGVLDIGCADGDLAFLFESLGCRVAAVDHPLTNHNHMRGIRALQPLLDSAIDIHEIDLDSQFALPDQCYGLTLFLGILYHLKNPLYVMERLAKHSKHCILSTRIARCFPDGTPMPQDTPIAYLLEADELNQDNSNFWIFSDAGLRRLLKRTHWEVLEYCNVGDTSTSNPTSPDRDERVFCLLKSHFGLANVDLLEGWHKAEDAGWRWTERRFSVRVSADAIARPERMVVRLFVPSALIDHYGPITLFASTENEEMRPIVFSEPGDHTFTTRFKRGCNTEVITFTLDKALPPDASDPRERGIIVASIDCE
jgi:tRNA (mo5U34)-methyltransferase